MSSEKPTKVERLVHMAGLSVRSLADRVALTSLETFATIASVASIGSTMVLGWVFYYSRGYMVAASLSVGIILGSALNWGVGQWTNNARRALVGQGVVWWVGLTLMTFAHGGLDTPNLIFVVIIGPMMIFAGFLLPGFLMAGFAVVLVWGAVWLKQINYLESLIIISEFQRGYTATVAVIVFGLVGFLRHLKVFAISQALDAERKLVEVEQKRAQEYQMKRRLFLASVNHEIRNPLTALVTASEELATCVLAGANADLRETLRATTEHLLAVVNDVLAGERQELGRSNSVVQEFSIRQCLLDCRSIYALKAQKLGVTIVVNVDEEVWLGSRYLLQQVVTNLISNSLKHSPGCVIRLTAKGVEGGLNVTVEDTGPGIDANKLPTLFTPYVSSSGDVGSTGLGLPICQRLVEEEMKGRLSLVSEPGLGVSFNIFVPFAKVAAPHSPVAVKRSARLDAYRVLLVEDDINNGAAMMAVFRKKGAQVNSANCVEDALSLLRSSRYDIIVVDKNLSGSPGVSQNDGIDLTRQISEMDQGIVIGFSGYCTEEIKAEWCAAGASEVLAKPAPFSELWAVISKHLPATASA